MSRMRGRISPVVATTGSSKSDEGELQLRCAMFGATHTRKWLCVL